MPTTTSSVLFAASLCAAVAAQSPATPLLPERAADTLAGGGGERATTRSTAGAAAVSTAELLRAHELSRPQEPDYSPRALFQQAHGDFMLKRERFNPMVELRASSLTDAAVQHEQGRFDLLRAGFDAEAPITVAHDGYLTFGAFYEGRHYSTKNTAGFGNETLYAAGGKFGFGWFLDENMLLEGMVQPGSWSDWDGTLHHKDFDFPASALLTVRYSDEIFWKIGARYNETFEDANVLPTVGFTWATESVRVDLLLPESFEVSLWPSADFGILFGAQIQGAQYHVRTNEALGSERADVRVQEAIVYTGALWRMNDYTSLMVRAGASVAGDYKLDEGQAATKRMTGTLEPALFLEVTFGLDF